MKWLKGREKDTTPKSLAEMRSWLDKQGFVYKDVYPLDALSKKCPWQFSQFTETSQIIGILFSPLKKKLPRMIAMLQERCVAMFAMQEVNQWYLLYVIQIEVSDRKTGFRIYRGGEPTTKPQLREEVRSLGWDTPPELKELYWVHNGFGAMEVPNDFWNCILPVHKLTVLSEYFKPIGNNAYDPKDLLEFFPDGAGNAQFFYRKGEEPMLTVDWDHETRELGEPEGFWEFVDRKLSNVDEDKYDWFGRLIKK